MTYINIKSLLKVNKIKKIKIKNALLKINNVLGIILLFFGVFDTTRNYTLLPVSFGYLKDIAVYLLFILNINKIKLKNPIITLITIVMVVISPLGFLFNGLDVLEFAKYLMKYMEIPLLLLIFLNFKSIFSYNIKEYFKWYILLALALSFINVFGYFVPNKIVSVDLANANMNRDMYKGRITVGQPALAIFPVLFAYCYYLINCNKLKKIFLPLILLALIFISTANTGIVAIIICSIIILLFSKNRHYIYIYLFSLLIISIVSLPFLISLIDVSMYTNKILSIISGGNDPSVDYRIMHWIQAFKNNDFLKYIFGSGAVGYIRNGDNFAIENTYVLIFLCYGCIGAILFLISIFKCLLKVFNLKKISTKNFIFLFCVIIIYLLHFITLDIFYCYMLYFPIGMYIAIYQDAKWNSLKMVKQQ